VERKTYFGHSTACGMNHRLLGLLVLCCSGGAPVVAATITVGDQRLLPNRPSQTITLRVDGGDLVSGVDLFMQVGDAGPNLAAFGLPPGTVGPAITGVDLIRDTIFHDVTDTVTDIGSVELKQTAMYTLALVGPVSAVPADGVLATVWLDTSGLFEGTWELRLSGVLPQPVFGGPHNTNFAGDVSTVIRNGSLTIATAPLNAGDANRDLVFDQYDLVHVLQAGKYLTSGPATWGDGDWDGAPGGSPGSPPTGNGRFDQADIVAALASGRYVTGPYAPALAMGESVVVSTVPEPGGLSLSLTVLVGLGILARRETLRRFGRCHRRALRPQRGGKTAVDDRDSI
jgi:hypothetical protein